LAYDVVSLNTVEGTREYEITGYSSPIPDIEAVYVQGYTTPLELIHEVDLQTLGDDGGTTGRPLRYYLTGHIAGVARIGLSPVPDQDYTINVSLKSSPPSYTTDTTSQPTPYGGVWDNWLVLQTAMDLRESVEGDVGYLVARAMQAFNQACNETYRRGIRGLGPSPRTGFFLPEGT
ncbi:MAG: hypothetical protein Q9M13_07015, partial [Mariprofundales bacterium]|nr:hypothetical protein [Mariprofundales bacterium]